MQRGACTGSMWVLNQSTTQKSTEQSDALSEFRSALIRNDRDEYTCIWASTFLIRWPIDNGGSGLAETISLAFKSHLSNEAIRILSTDMKSV